MSIKKQITDKLNQSQQEKKTSRKSRKSSTKSNVKSMKFGVEQNQGEGFGHLPNSKDD